MARICLKYADGTQTFATLLENDEGVMFKLGGELYTVNDMIGTGAMAIVNTPEVLRKLQESGMPCRPTPKQNTLSISVSADTQRRLREAAKATQKTVSGLIEEVVRKWLDDNCM